MNDYTELILRLNEILGHKGELTSNPNRLELGAYRMNTKGHVTFALDGGTCLAYPADRVSEQAVQFISLLIHQEAKQKQRSQHDQQESLQGLMEKIIGGSEHLDYRAAAKSLGIEPDQAHLPMIVKRGEELGEWEEIIGSYFSGNAISAFVDGLGYYLIPLSHLSLDEGEKEGLEEVAHGLSGLLCEEGFARFRLSFSEPVKDIEQWKDSFESVKKSLAAGHFFHPQHKVYFSWKLALERMLVDLPEEGKREFSQAILGEKASPRFCEEMYSTLHVFLENNLNISETARKLFIHRNTLIYRLEKFKEETGRDVRIGNEAMIVYLALLLRKGLQQIDQIF